MAPVCTICGHPAREQIDRALVRGESMRGLARQHGVSDDAIRRHRDSHLAAALAKTVEQERVELSAANLQRWSLGLHSLTLRLLKRAEEIDDLGNARGLVREARENLTLLGRLGGVIDGPTIHVDARQQVAVLGRLSEDELRALAASAPAVGSRLPELTA